MLGRFRDGALELRAPGLKRLTWPSIDQIERITIEDRARNRNSVERFLRAVQAAQFPECAVVEGLNAKRDPVDAGVAVTSKTSGLHAGRIGLERDFDIVRNGPMFGD